MRSLLVVIALGALVLPACVVAVRHPHHHWHGHHHRHGHFHRHYRNHAGEAYVETGMIRNLAVLPVTLPADIDGSGQWPMQSAQVIASVVTAHADIDVSATASTLAPIDGHVLNVKVSEFAPGTEQAATVPEPAGWSRMSATGTIVNARTGKVVVELSFEISCARNADAPPIDALSHQVGESLVEWFRAKKGVDVTG